MKKFIVIILSLVFGLSLALSAHAQQTGLDITISPTLLDITADPGATVDETFRIRNNGGSGVKLHISVDKLNPDSSNGQVLPISARPGDATTSWLQFESTDLTANPKEWTTVKFSIHIPQTAAFGYYYAVRIGQESSTTANEKVLGEVILPVLLNVKKDGAKAEMRLDNFSTPSYINELLPVTFNTTLSNTGNVHLRPHGNIFITQGDTTVGVLDINQTLGNVLPGGKRLFTSSWDDGFLVNQPVIKNDMVVLDKDNHPVTHLVINWNKLTSFRIGKYTAHALLVYDNGEKDVTLESTTSFWVIPWKFLLGCFIGLILVVIFARWLLGWYIAREVKKRVNS